MLKMGKVKKRTVIGEVVLNPGPNIGDNVLGRIVTTSFFV
jgi:hypothetical protein